MWIAGRQVASTAPSGGRPSSGKQDDTRDEGDGDEADEEEQHFSVCCVVRKTREAQLLYWFGRVVYKEWFLGCLEIY